MKNACIKSEANDKVTPTAPVGWRSLFDISDRDALFEVRGFRATTPDAQRRLESVGGAFIMGYREGLFSGVAGPDQQFLQRLPEDFQGFGAEGAAMGCAVADFSSLKGRRLSAWLHRTDRSYTYLTHVGAGWAMARLPFGKRAIFQQLDPIHCWLAVDGMGFHDSYFHHQRILKGWRREKAGYAAHAYHQGIGRALWFVGGADPIWAVEAICEKFDPGFRGDLWAGLGLAIAYAGCADAAALAQIRSLAGAWLPDLVQGAIFGAAAHACAGPAPAHTGLALGALAGLAPAEAKAIADTTRAALPHSHKAQQPAYESWRQAVRSRFALSTALAKAA